MDSMTNVMLLATPVPQTLHLHNTPSHSLGCQLGRHLLQLLGTLKVDNFRHLARVAHQLLGPGVQHAQLAVARRWQVVQHDVRHRESAGGLDVV
jgi:hypothetical protein